MISVGGFVSLLMLRLKGENRKGVTWNVRIKCFKEHEQK